MAETAYHGAPVALSPIRALRADADSVVAGVVVEDLSLRAKVAIRCDDHAGAAAVLGTGFGRAASRDGRLVCGSGPGEWLVIGAEGSGPSLVAELRERLAGIEALTTVIDLTHGRALVRVSGPRVLDLLPRLTAFDLDDRVVPDGAAWRTSVAGVVTDLVRDDAGGATDGDGGSGPGASGPSYVLHVERSSGQYLVDTLLAAGADLSCLRR